MECIIRFKKKIEKDNMGNYFFTPTIYHNDYCAVQILSQIILKEHKDNDTIYDKNYIRELYILEQQLYLQTQTLYTTISSNWSPIAYMPFSPEQTKRFLRLKELVENPVVLKTHKIYRVEYGALDSLLRVILGQNNIYDKNYIEELSTLKSEVYDNVQYDANYELYMPFSPEQTKLFLKLKELAENPIYTKKE